MNELTDDDLTRWERLCEAAVYSDEDSIARLGNEAFTALPLLIAEVRRMRAGAQEPMHPDKLAALRFDWEKQFRELNQLSAAEPVRIISEPK